MSFIRKKNRLSPEIYQKNNWYFITICSQDRYCVMDFMSSFNLIYDDTVVASTKAKISLIIKNSLLNLLELYDDIGLDCWVIMPNHIHFIISLGNNPNPKLTQKNANLGEIIKSFKLHSQRCIVEATTASPSNCFNYHKFWQKSFYDHVIRNEQDLLQTREYIQNNQINWKEDVLNKENQAKYDAWINKN